MRWLLFKARHPVLVFLLWRAPRVRGTEERPLNERDLRRMWRFMELTGIEGVGEKKA